MNIYRYTTKGGKDLIKGYLDKLPIKEKAYGYEIMEVLEEEGLAAFDDNLYILHACKKQKGKAELFELNKAIKRAKELGTELNKKFV